ncbi:hypothetical protein UPYG_G00308790 [Umbra pygmaea]|uniref:Ig-like domain-containing protein n=1 Tax=Umbra pygmaea TaxID=75934 RepID=A0ABD0WHA6_UMBPY
MWNVQHYIWVISHLYFLSGFIQWGGAMVMVEMQASPLYRVIGYPISIYCNVSGFSDPSALQNFQFSIYKPNKPSQEIQIISTAEKDFAMAVYSQRVRDGDITLDRLSVTSVLFKVKSLKSGDEGDYECYTPNTERVYHGTYSAKTTLKVIEDTLIASSTETSSLSLTVGDNLDLQCLASSNTYQHTHLSITWYLHRDGQASPSPIISLDRYLTVNPGLEFESRYRAGLISLDKMEEATYRLKMSRVEMPDAGRIYCQAQEWIQDPDRSWYPIAKKDAQETTLTVKAKEVAPEPGSGSISVSMKVEEAQLNEGGELAVQCTVDVQGMTGQFFSVAWMKDNQELAKIGPTGVLDVGPEYKGRESDGELRAMRTGQEKIHLLTLRPVRTQDQGAFHCRVWSNDRDDNGVFKQGPSQDSATKPVTIKATESGLAVAMATNEMSVSEGGELRITCKVSGARGQLSITWQRRSVSMSTGPFSDVISLSQMGVQDLGAEFKQRKVGALRSTGDTFILELRDIVTSDAGSYQCTVSEWTTESNGNAKKTNSQSQVGSVNVLTVESQLKVKLNSRGAQVMEGGEVELLCGVKGPRFPITVTWSLMREGESAPENILTFSNTGDIKWRGDQSSYQLSVTASNNQVLHTLRIIQASRREAGQYQCEISAFLQGRHRKLHISNQLAVLVQPPKSVLTLSSSKPPVDQSINTDVLIQCSVTKATSTASRFAVEWVVQKQEGNQTILSSDRDAVVTLGAGVSTDQRISMRRREGRSFELTIRQTRIDDSGTYYCVVEEWLQDPLGQWYKLQPSSAAIELRLKETVSDLSVDKTDKELKVRDGDGVELICSLIAGASGPASLYALTWFYKRGSFSSSVKVPLVIMGRDGILTYPEDQEHLRPQGLKGRLTFSRPTHSTFQLGLQRAHQGDSGAYQCQVDQYQLNDGKWKQTASDKSGTTILTVKPIESVLTVSASPSLLGQNLDTDVQMDCSIVRATSNSSRFAVTWLAQKGQEGNMTILSSDHDAVVSPGVGLSTGQRISMRRREGRGFELTIRQTRIDDSGTYYCVVEEWLQDPLGQWYKLQPSSAAIELRLKETVSDLSVDKTDKELKVRDGDGVELTCSLTAGASGPASLYALTWLYKRGSSSSSVKVPLVIMGRDGILTYPEDQEHLRPQGLKGRLTFSRPTHSTYQLGLQRAHQGDSGAYQCQVDQYQLNDGKWKQTASDKSGTTNLTVKPIESVLTVSASPSLLGQNLHTDVQMDCSIVRATSNSSRFAVTWLAQKGEGNMTILTSDRDAVVSPGVGLSTGQRISMRRREGRGFELTIRQSRSNDSGMYYCVVEEWLQDALGQWYKFQPSSAAIELRFNATGSMSTSEPDCATGLVLGIFISLFCVLAILIIVLSIKLKGRGSAGKKTQLNTLWAEENPLKPVQGDG